MNVRRPSHAPGRKSTWSTASAGFRRFLRPCVESLEPRRLLACDVFVREGTLFVLGDDADNDIRIVATPQSVSIVCGEQTFLVADEFEAVQVQGGDGHDLIDLEVAVGDEPAVWTIDAGGGDNETHVRFGDGERGRIPATGGRIQATYRSGQGNDNVLIAIEGIFADISLDVSTGGGNDTVGIHETITVGAAQQITVGGRQSVDLGAGNDRATINIQIGDPNEAPPPMDFLLKVTPGPDDDEVLVNFEHGDARRPFVLGALWSSDSPPDSGGRQPAAEKITIHAQYDMATAVEVDVAIDGSRGPDTLQLHTSAPTAIPGEDSIIYVIDISGSMDAGDDDFHYTGVGAVDTTVHLDTGPGDDRVDILLESSAAEVLQKVRIDTGSGNDVVNVKVPAVQADGLDDIVVGADAGGGPHVKVIDGFTTSEVQSFFAYPPSFSGGVRVATGDVNGDGVADIITGAGPGGGPHVKVFDGRTNAELMSFFAYGASFSGGVYVAAGDVNGDGRADIITGSGAGSPGGHVKVFDGRSGAELQSFFAFPGFTGGVRVATGDVNGDGRDDIIVGAGPGAGGGHVKVFDGASGALLHSFFSFESFSGGVHVAAGDVSGDGRADIIVGADAGAGPHVKIFSGATGQELRSFFAFDANFTGGVRVAAGDINGDGVADIIVGAGPGAGPHVKVFDGRTNELLKSFFAFDGNFTGGVFVAAADLHGARPPRTVNLDLAISTAAGNDMVTVHLSPTATESLLQKVRIDAGAGSDDVQIDVLFTGGPGTIATDYRVALGAGNDRLQFTADQRSGGLGETLPVQIGNWILDASGGAGDDQMLFSFSEGLHFTAPARLSLSGDAGNDKLSLNFRSSILDGAAVDAVLSGGSGNDSLSALFDLGPMSRGKLSVKLLGGPGDDELTLEVHSADELAELLVLLDGGPGKNRSRAPAGAATVNAR